MMTWAGFKVVLLAAAAATMGRQTPNAVQAAHPENAVMKQIDESGRCATLGKTAEQRVAGPPKIAPGQAPIVSFKYYEDAKHHRFGNINVMLDDAGH